ncbi:hypothetical protein KEM60_00293 [Austwickia sp. TVS 96-490-7B]|uniref:hypothetical protein n=1 Tax=Austwickia sp. TVS 96-490-7B TaxID=2830843 RepID=UPI001C5716B9|nr:hypothetical protein [Austwickia sp. TVS 96-490-7B]MBW3084110.1 hypothetical protein [Austwickia sp. TVS 96-490-7B]
MDLEFDPDAVARLQAVVNDANQNAYDIARGIQRRLGEGTDPLSHPDVSDALRQGFARNFAAVQMGQAILLCLQTGVPVRDVLTLLDLEALMDTEKSFDDELTAFLDGDTPHA